MPWRVKRQAILLLIGVAVASLAVIVFVLNQDASSDLLAVIGLLGGVAIVVNTLPENGHDRPGRRS